MKKINNNISTDFKVVILEGEDSKFVRDILEKSIIKLSLYPENGDIIDLENGFKLAVRDKKDPYLVYNRKFDLISIVYPNIYLVEP